MSDKRMLLSSLLVCALLPAAAGEPVDAIDHLPPQLPWNGKSESLVLPPDHGLATPIERTAFRLTPGYEETTVWLQRLVGVTTEAELVSIGKSAEGRDIWMVVVAREPDRSAAGLRASDKPTVLVQAGIHSGEIDGKDAGLMLLRDLTVRRKHGDLLDRVNLLFVPILSVDGHERVSRYNRINQRGPEEMGWRTNARNLNLNRDYTKLETEEVRAIVQVIDEWQPELYIDLHVTDGTDYQYDVTWGATPSYAWAPHGGGWIEGAFTEAVDKRLEEMGHLPGPFVWGINGRDHEDGLAVWVGSPRFSNVYGAARYLPTILVENHSLKPYKQRVLGTYVFLEAALDFVGRNAASLRAAIEKDRAARPDRIVLAWTGNESSRSEKRQFKGVRSETFDSPISGGRVVRWTGETLDRERTFFHQNIPAVTVERPAYYYIPAGWSHIADKLRLHGIELERLRGAARVEVEMYRLPDAGLAGAGSAFDHRAAVYEGRVRIDPGEPTVERRTIELPAGSYRASTDQPLGTLLVMLLEPAAPDSFFQWGYFLEILTQPEYAEPYVMEPMARAMLAADPELKRAFEKKLAADAEFAADPRARLLWFYRRTPYFDERYRLYPIARSPKQ